MNGGATEMRTLTAAESAHVSGGASSDEFLASALGGAAAGAAVGAPVGGALLPPGGVAIGAAVGGLVGGFFGGMQYAVSELFDYCF